MYSELINFYDSVILGDNIEVLKLFPNNSVKLVLTSPPYDKLRDYEDIRFDFPIFQNLAKQLFRILHKDGIIVWIVGDATIKGSETGSSFKQALYFRELGLKLHDTMFYEKSAFAYPSTNRYHQVIEYMFVLAKGNVTFNPLKDRPNLTKYDFGKQRRKRDGTMTNLGVKDRIKLDDFGMRRNIWYYSTGKGNSSKYDFAFLHPAIFPEALAKDHIHTWTNENDLVLDVFNGSGTTAVMSSLMNRRFIGIDLSELYCKIALQRFRFKYKNTLEQHKLKKIKYFKLKNKELVKSEIGNYNMELRKLLELKKQEKSHNSS
jgi:site-specific DNA-methyltransferase (adenine-specific)